MAGHLASDFSFLPAPGGGGDGPAGLELDGLTPSLVEFPWPSGLLKNWDGLGLGAEAWGIPWYPPLYEFCGGVAYCGPQVGVGMVPQGGLETPQPKGEVGAGVESNSKGTSPEPCAALPGPREAGAKP